MSVFGQYAPYDLSEGDWDSRRGDVERQFVDLISRFAPDFADCLDECEVLGPPDIESRIGLTGGNIFQGEVTPDQMWEGRLPARTPVPGLYLCGAATHPAGSVIALNGRNAAAAMLADQGEPVDFAAPASRSAVAEGTRERILEAACDLIAAEGIDDVRIARVAMRAGASTALVHHYFSTREELLEQALLHSFELVGDERFAGGEGEGETATTRLAAAIEECLPQEGRLERDWVLWVELWLRAARDPDLRPVATELYQRYRDWLSGVIEAGVKSGEFEAPADLDRPRRPGDGAARRDRPAGAAARPGDGPRAGAPPRRRAARRRARGRPGAVDCAEGRPRLI